MNLNKNFLSLENDYFFCEISSRIKDFIKSNPKKEIISLGIGDTILPLTKAVIKAIKKATNEMAFFNTYKGYGPENGYLFLRNAIKDYYKKMEIRLSCNEIFISDGAGSDIGNIVELFSKDNKVLITDPTYPAYKDSNIMFGRKISFIKSNKENSFLPLPNKNTKADIIYICSPNNPTGSVYNRSSLKKWVNFAINSKAVIIFDAAYEAFVEDKNLIRSIFEIKDAQKCAIEIASLSKTAGFTGIRCGYTIMPEKLIFKNISLNKLWFRRQSTKFNGVSYITQKAAEAVFTKSGQEEIKKNINYYKENAKLISEALKELNIESYWSKNSPYIWVTCPKNLTSWNFFEILLKNYQIISVPGVGFGKQGEYYIRLSGFASKKNTLKAINRLKL